MTAGLCLFYLAVTVHKLFTVMLSLVRPGEVRVPKAELEALDEGELPVYTVLVPLYKEAEVADKLVRSILSLDYPRDKLDAILLLEEDDPTTREALGKVELPPCVRTLVVPEGSPKTKPRACNYGLAEARGELLVIYDAEDRPESDQLKKAVAAFKKLPSKVICLQAKLNYYNPRQNWLTKWFTIEYTTWFDLFLPGLNTLGVPIPLGGTSNHFKTEALKELGGWDPFNVAEDCDLGMRLHASGLRTRVLDSTTWEEANSRLGNWIRQRSRWVKGYVQTHLVHTRERLTGWRIPWLVLLGGVAAWGIGRVVLHLGRFMIGNAEGELRLAGEAAVWELVLAACGGGLLLLWGFLKGARRMGTLGYASFLVTVGGLSLTLLLNIVFWAVGIAWLFIRWRIWYETSYLDDAMTRLNYWSVVSHWFWAITIVLLVSNLVFIFVHVMACIRRRLVGLIPLALLVPLYWFLISVAAWRGFIQLFTRAHYWDKTTHGLLGKSETGGGP